MYLQFVSVIISRVLFFFKSKSLFNNYITSILQVGLTSLMYVFIYYMILHKLGKVELGVWSIISAIPFTVGQIGSGVSGTVLRFVPRYISDRDFQSYNSIVYNALLTNLSIGLIIICLGYFFTHDFLIVLLGNGSVKSIYFSYFRISLLTFFINFLNSVLISTLDGLQLVYKRNLILILGSIVFALSTLFLIPYVGIAGVFYGQLLQAFVLFVSLFIIYALEESCVFQFWKFNLEFIRLFFSLGWKFQVISLTVIFFDPVSKYYINRYFGLSIVGIYDVVNRGISQLRLLIVSGGQAIIPRISGIERNSLQLKSDLYVKYLKGMDLLSLILFSIYIPLSLFLLNKFDIGNSELYSYTSFLLLIAYYINIISTPAYTFLLGAGNLSYLVKSHVLSSGLNIILFLVLGNLLPPVLVVLPIAISIAVSSYFLIYSFKKEGGILENNVSSSINAHIYVTFVGLISTIFFANFSIENTHFIFVYLFHLVLLYYILRKNEFILLIKDTIVSRLVRQ